MSFVYECERNNRYDTMRDEFALYIYIQLLTNRLRFIINKMTKMARPCIRERVFYVCIDINTILLYKPL